MEDPERLCSRDWKTRLSYSREKGKGFAAPGGEFTRALYEWALTDEGSALRSLLHGQRVVELGAGTLPYGYALAVTCGARNFVAVEPFYSDVQETAVQSFIADNPGVASRIAFKVSGLDMLDYLMNEPDDLLCIIACGIEDCILPGADYKLKVEREIQRTLRSDAFFVSSHSDLYPQGLRSVLLSYSRPANHSVVERLRLHGGKDAFELHGQCLSGIPKKDMGAPSSTRF
jgi:hypothetical protein